MVQIVIMRHRSDTEIIALILEAINISSGATQTRIMYEAYLSYAQLKGYLSSLLEKNLIEYQKADRIYMITKKGTHFLQIYNQFNQLQINNIFTTTTKYENEEGSYLTHEKSRSNQWKCEKCQKSLANLKELKIHKLEYHSY
jgi:predicted transcriptional regulator